MPNVLIPPYMHCSAALRPCYMLHIVLKVHALPLQAHNGSGKTTCFVLAMLSRVDPDLAQPQALCVCPTR